MGFKDDLKGDLETVFFDPDEFGEKHMVNGKEMLISIDEAELTQRKRSLKSSSYEEAIHTKHFSFFVSGKVFGKLPKVNSQLTIDRVKFLVTETRVESGVYVITLTGGNR